MEVDICISWASWIIKNQCRWTFLFLSSWLVVAHRSGLLLCAVPPHSNTQPVLLVVLQSLAPQQCLMNVGSGSTWAFLCLKAKVKAFCQRGNNSSARRSAIGYSKKGGRNFCRGLWKKKKKKRFCKWLAESRRGLRFTSWLNGAFHSSTWNIS